MTLTVVMISREGQMGSQLSLFFPPRSLIAINPHSAND